MSKLWSPIVAALKPYVPGEQPRMADLVKLNTNESPYGPSERALEAIRAAADTNLRLYPDPVALGLREAIAARHEVWSAKSSSATVPTRSWHTHSRRC